MSSKLFVLTAYILAAVVIALGRHIIEPNLNSQDGGNINLVFLGNIDGKSYFADNVTRSWVQAREYCTSLQMHLATVLTKGQWDLLNAAYDNVTFTDHYWTGARDAHELRQLSWDLNSTAITSTAVASFGNDVGSLPQTCAALASTINSLSLHIDECSVAHKVLCET